MRFSKLFELLVLDVLISWHCDVNYEAGLLLLVDQHKVKPIVTQMFVSLNEEVPENLGTILLDYFFLDLTKCGRPRVRLSWC